MPKLPQESDQKRITVIPVKVGDTALTAALRNAGLRPKSLLLFVTATQLSPDCQSAVGRRAWKCFEWAREAGRLTADPAVICEYLAKDMLHILDGAPVGLPAFRLAVLGLFVECLGKSPAARGLLRGLHDRIGDHEAVTVDPERSLINRVLEWKPGEDSGLYDDLHAAVIREVLACKLEPEAWSQKVRREVERDMAARQRYVASRALHDPAFRADWMRYCREVALEQGHALPEEDPSDAVFESLFESAGEQATRLGRDLGLPALTQDMDSGPDPTVTVTAREAPRSGKHRYRVVVLEGREVNMPEKQAAALDLWLHGKGQPAHSGETALSRAFNWLAERGLSRGRLTLQRESSVSRSR